MTAAAKSLDTNTATVSRHIHRMTEIYGTVLFVKKKTRWELTSEGEALVRVIETFEKGLHDLDRNNGLDITAGRSIKIATFDFLSSTFLLPQLGRFLAENAGVSVEFVCRDNHVSLAYGEADISVLLSRPQEGRLIGRKAADVTFSAYRRAGSGQQDWIALGEELDWTPQMRFGQDTFGRPPLLRVQSYEAVRQSAVSTGLAGILPDNMVKQSDGLQLLETDQPSVKREVWAIYHDTRKMDPVVRLAADWVVRCFDARNTIEARSVA